jgi:hypothetical protein
MNAVMKQVPDIGMVTNACMNAQKVIQYGNKNQYLNVSDFYDIIPTMKKLILFLFVASLAACQSATQVEEYNDETTCVGENCAIINYSMPNGNDLVLETAHHKIEIAAQPNVKYGYYVWAGDKDTSDDPDLVVEDGTAMVLIEE